MIYTSNQKMFRPFLDGTTKKQTGTNLHSSVMHTLAKLSLMFTILPNPQIAWLKVPSVENNIALKAATEMQKRPTTNQQEQAVERRQEIPTWIEIKRSCGP